MSILSQSESFYLIVFFKYFWVLILCCRPLYLFSAHRPWKLSLITFWRMGNPVSGVTHTKQNLENVDVGRGHNEAGEVSITELFWWILALTQKSCIAVNIFGKCKSGVRFVDLRQKGCFLRNVLLSNNGHEPQNTNCISIVKEKSGVKMDNN